jgi:hypothetical protein
MSRTRASSSSVSGELCGSKPQTLRTISPDEHVAMSTSAKCWLFRIPQLVACAAQTLRQSTRSTAQHLTAAVQQPT